MDGTNLKFVNEFKYLGCLIIDQNADIGERIKLAWVEARRLPRIWVSGEVTSAIKHRLLSSCILSIMLYGSEAWTLTTPRAARLNGAHTKLLRYCLNKPFTEHPTLEELRGGRMSITQMITKRRMTMIGKVWRASHGDRVAPQVLAEVLFWQPDLPPFGQEGLTYRRQLEADFEGGSHTQQQDSYRKRYEQADSATKMGQLMAAMGDEKGWQDIIARRVEGVGEAERQKLDARRRAAARAKNLTHH
jgi:hypothetical protein